MVKRLFIVDTEATHPTPMTGVMTEFGVVDFTTKAWFHGHLWDFHPEPDVPARPVATARNPEFTATLPGNIHDLAFDGARHTIDPLRTDRERSVYSALDAWLRRIAGDDQIGFVSDNPAFDFMWIVCGFDSHGPANPFGFTGRRIGDLAAGLERNWLKTSAWKKLRRTKHDHNPVNDALGNAEALHALLAKHDQIKTR